MIISESILSLVFNQMCDDAVFALETLVFCLFCYSFLKLGKIIL